MKKKIYILGIVTIMLAISFRMVAQTADTSYLDDVKELMSQQWPNNRTINFVFHGHSVPSGYFQTPDVQTLKAYPHQTLEQLKELYPYAVINCITTGIGGENSEQGALRFANDVLTHRPDVLFIDYAINDYGLDGPRAAWKMMIEAALAKGIKVMLMTPTPVESVDILDPNTPLAQRAQQIRNLSQEYKTGLVDSYEAFRQLALAGVSISGFLSNGINHPNAEGHKIVADLIINYCK
jgi:lysophospholipase L1-like esterase